MLHFTISRVTYKTYPCFSRSWKKISLQRGVSIHKWDRQQKIFSESTKTYDLSKEREFLNYLAKKLNILSPDGWNHVSKRDIMENGGAILLDRYNGSIAKMINAIYNEYP